MQRLLFTFVLLSLVFGQVGIQANDSNSTPLPTQGKLEGKWLQQ